MKASVKDGETQRMAIAEAAATWEDKNILIRLRMKRALGL
jgi:hypothetical protein